ncbi:MAG: glycosyltransferase [Pseudomonadota bacterium]
MIEKNVLLFWDKEPVPDGYARAVLHIKDTLPGANIVSLNDATAALFLQDSYGARHRDAFEACTLPAMRSDLIRLAWIARHGGLYVDWRYRPRSKVNVLFKNRFEDLTCYRLQIFKQPIINNAIFLAPAGSPLLSQLRDAAFDNVFARKEGTVSALTGPDLFTRHVATLPAERVKIFGRQYFFDTYFENAQQGQHGFDKSHWFTQNIFGLSDLYRD